MNVLTVIQARLGSSRFPGKVLKPLGESNVLLEMVRRVRRAKKAGIVLVAIPDSPLDDKIEQICKAEGIPCFRGDENDLLDRHIRAAHAYEADAVVKIPSDCPLIDPAVIDRVLGVFLGGDYDFVSNLHPQSYPDGNDVEVMTFSALESAWKEADRPYEREHTTPYIWDSPDRFKLGNVSWETGDDYSKSHRFVLDYEEDYHFIKAVFEELSGEFSLGDILALLERKPEIRELNAKHLGDGWYGKHAAEFRTAQL